MEGHFFKNSVAGDMICAVVVGKSSIEGNLWRTERETKGQGKAQILDMDEL